MSRFERRQRRQLARQWAASGTTLEAAQACINSLKASDQQLHDYATDVAYKACNKVRDKLQQHIADEVIPHVQGDMICLFLYVLHTTYGFGVKRLRDAATAMWEAVGEMQATQSDGQVLADTIKAETGLDLQKLFDELSARSKRGEL